MCSPSCLFLMRHSPFLLFFFFFNDTATTEIYTLSLHDALPIWNGAGPGKLLPHAAHDVADRGGERYRHGDFGAPDELRVAGEKADANRARRVGRHSDPEEIGRASCRERG